MEPRFTNCKANVLISTQELIEFRFNLKKFLIKDFFKLLSRDRSSLGTCSRCRCILAFPSIAPAKNVPIYFLTAYLSSM